jgi:hypothetical protein
MDQVYPPREDPAMAEAALVLQEPAAPTVSAPARPPLERAWFSLAFVWLTLFLFPFPLDFTPYTGKVGELYASLVWHRIVPWVGADVLRLQAPVQGGRDRQVLLALIVGPMGWGIWTRAYKPKPPLAGFYEVVEFKGPRPWKNVEISNYGSAFVLRVDGSRLRYVFSHDAEKDGLLPLDGVLSDVHRA